jgi:cysteine desulfurase/selenocysteine lyase
MISNLAAEFPILAHPVQGRRLVYLDNAATTQKPRVVMEESRRYYETLNSNIHRGTHYLARASTEAFEAARRTVAGHLKAARPEEIVFTSGTTDGVNLVANILGLSGGIGAGDEILISALEHHSNIVPWQMLCQRTGAQLRVIPCDETGVLDPAAFREMLGPRTKVLAVTWISNALGTVVPVREMVAMARTAGAITLVDAAQAVAHMHIDVADLGADFLVFSGHKVYANTGIGVLWGRYDLLEKLPPWRGGGEMIKEVTFEGTTYNDPPFKYEAGTPNIEGALSLAAALRFVNDIGLDEIRRHEDSLLRETSAAISDIEGIRLYGPADRACALSFGFNDAHHYDIGTLLDQMGVAVRTGHHCCQPLMARFGISGTIRASFALYNTSDDVAEFAAALRKALRMVR